MHPCVETMMGLFGGPNLLNEGHFNPVPGMLLVEKRRRARTEMHERIGMQMQVNGNRPTIGRANPDNVQADEASFEVNVEKADRAYLVDELHVSGISPLRHGASKKRKGRHHEPERECCPPAG